MSVAYAGPPGGLPPQAALSAGRAAFTGAYAVIPRGVMRDIVTSRLPHWRGARVWVLARPMSGFAETFAQYVVELAPGGGSDLPEPDPCVEGALFVTAGAIEIALDGAARALTPGDFAFLPAGAAWRAASAAGATFHWIRKRFEPVEGLDPPPPVFACDADTAPDPMPDCDGAWATTRFIDPDDLRFDMHVTIVTLRPGAAIPFAETHVMEHGLYVLQGKAVYLLNRDWVEVEAGDFMWLRAFCPQACVAAGPDPFRYLLYKDVNRHPRL